MEIRLTEKAQQQFLALPKVLRRKTEKQFGYLLRDYRHPSLKSKKYHEATGELWQARIDAQWRFYFFIQHPAYIVVAIIAHPK